MYYDLASDYIRRWGGLLFCRHCHHLSPVSSSDQSKYVRSGWPTCCGETKLYITKIDDPALVRCMNTDKE